MVTEPEPGFVSLVDRLGKAWSFLRRVQAGTVSNSDAIKFDDPLEAILDAIEALQMEDGSSQGLKPAVSGGREDAPTWRPVESAPKDGTKFDAWVPSRFGGYRMTDLSFGWNGKLRQHGELSAKELPRWPTHWRPLPAPPTEEPTP